MTLEAALCLPIFIAAMWCVINCSEIYRVQGNISASLANKARNIAIGNIIDGSYTDETTNAVIRKGSVSYLSSRIEDQSNIRLEVKYRLCLAVGMPEIADIRAYNKLETRIWRGYDTTCHTPEDEEEMVYVTESGSAYHTSVTCPYLKLSLRAVSKDIVDQLRNEDRDIYYPCDECGNRYSHTVFITQYGDRYHTTLKCKKIKRNIQMVPLSSVESRHECQKCRGNICK